MARIPKLAVSYTRQALRELDEIWEYNARKYDRDHATEYVIFLQTNINALAINYPRAKRVNNFPELRQATFKRNPSGDGHVAIFEINQANGSVNVLHLYHEKQDIRGRLEREGY